MQVLWGNNYYLNPNFTLSLTFHYLCSMPDMPGDEFSLFQGHAAREENDWKYIRIRYRGYSEFGIASTMPKKKLCRKNLRNPYKKGITLKIFRYSFTSSFGQHHPVNKFFRRCSNEQNRDQKP